MNQRIRARVVAMTLLTVCSGIAGSVGAEERTCKAVHADLVERRSTVGCKPEHNFCFLGEVDGNHGLRGTTYFRGDSGAAGPSTSPGFISYSGQFEYTTDRGMLIMRETGVVNQTQGNLESGAITAFQKIVDATGEFAGASGYLFVSGFNRGGQITTQVFGEICLP